MVGEVQGRWSGRRLWGLVGWAVWCCQGALLCRRRCVAQQVIRLQPVHVGNLVARTSRAAELAAVSRVVMWTRTHVSFAQEHARGEPHVAPQRALGAANRRARSRLSEGDETQKYAVESRRAAVYRVAHASWVSSLRRGAVKRERGPRWRSKATDHSA
eukprot:scaffold16823_cov64-Phaeocystis_antarctica.AAC.2